MQTGRRFVSHEYDIKLTLGMTLAPEVRLENSDLSIGIVLGDRMGNVNGVNLPFWGVLVVLWRVLKGVPVCLTYTSDHVRLCHQ